MGWSRPQRAVVCRQATFPEHRAAARLFFKCPAKCGNFIVDVDPTFVDLQAGGLQPRVERCPCGAGVCPQCHALVPIEETHSHRCPDAARSRAHDDAATQNIIKRLGKKCPNCGLFIIKNQVARACPPAPQNCLALEVVLIRALVRGLCPIRHPNREL